MITSSPLISIRYVYTSQWRRKGVLPTCLPGFMIKHNFEIIQVNFFKVKNQVPTRRCRFPLTYWLTLYGQSKTVAEKIKHYSVFLNCATAFRIWKDYTKINMGVTRDETFYDTSEICVEEITFVSFGRQTSDVRPKKGVLLFFTCLWRHFYYHHLILHLSLSYPFFELIYLCVVQTHKLYQFLSLFRLPWAS